MLERHVAIIEQQILSDGKLRTVNDSADTQHCFEWLVEVTYLSFEIPLAGLCDVDSIKSRQPAYSFCCSKSHLFFNIIEGFKSNPSALMQVKYRNRWFCKFCKILNYL